jgi:hypothetical protein
MANKLLIAILLNFLLITQLSGQQQNPKRHKIQIALLLDVSGSMSGLITQAQSQIWRIVNEISHAEKNNVKPLVQLAFGTFGNVDFEGNGFFKMYTPLTNDIDLIAENLFTLSTLGEHEYCGYAIQCALDSLQWSDSKDDYKVIFIAGNESFNQGATDYVKVCKYALKRNIILNTIYCGPKELGISQLWEDAAGRAKGKYMSINHDTKEKSMGTIWDNKLIDYGEQFNRTYVPYGKDGEKNLMRQKAQDDNAAEMGENFMRERILFKASSSYDNEHWDLVDAYKKDNSIVASLESSDFPPEMQSMTVERKKQYLERKMREREVYKDGMKMYYEKSQEFLKISEGDNYAIMIFDRSIMSILKEQAGRKDFIFK